MLLNFKTPILFVLLCCLISDTISEDSEDEESEDSTETPAKPTSHGHDTADITTSKTCPAGWIKYKYTKCFKFYAKTKSQGAAQKACEAMEANLASIGNSLEDLDFLVALMNKATLHSTLPESAWLGGMKRNFGRWFWLDLSWFQRERYYLDYDLRTRTELECLVLKSFPEPASRYVSPPGKMMVGVDGHKLNVRSCEEQHAYFCQKQIEIPVQLLVHEYM